MGLGECARGSFRRNKGLLIAAGCGLVLLTLVAALPISPEGPFDARDYSRPEGLQLEFPAAGAVIEPVAAAGHALIGAPNYVAAIVATLIWVAVAAGVVRLVKKLCAKERGKAWAVILCTLASSAAAVWVFFVYLWFAAVVHLPSWRLAADDPDVVFADLQTHTFASHDGLISARDNLEFHAARGFSVVGVTEHDYASGAIEVEKFANSLGESLPGVIPGIEVRLGGNRHLLGLGLKNDTIPERVHGSGFGHADVFTDAMHEDHDGAVIAMSWNLTVENIRHLGEIGVDAFELVNTAYPRRQKGIRTAMLEEAKNRGLPLVASSDWHGWGGFWRSWTAVRIPGAPGMTRREKAQAVLELLRERRADAFTPVVAGYVGSPSALRKVFSPVVEAFRYAAELSPVRVLSWWVWVVLVVAAADLLARAGLRPLRALVCVVLMVLGGIIVYRGCSIFYAWMDGQTYKDFAGKGGAWIAVIGLVAFLSGLVTFVLELRRRKQRAGQAGPSSTAQEEATACS